MTYRHTAHTHTFTSQGAKSDMFPFHSAGLQLNLQLDTTLMLWKDRQDCAVLWLTVFTLR